MTFILLCASTLKLCDRTFTFIKLEIKLIILTIGRNRVSQDLYCIIQAYTYIQVIYH